MKRVILFIVSLVLVSCESIPPKSAKEQQGTLADLTDYYPLTGDMLRQGCRVYQAKTNAAYITLIFVTCPGVKTVNYMSGKAKRVVITLNGEKYEKVDTTNGGTP
jgi:hypothetical protein